MTGQRQLALKMNGRHFLMVVVVVVVVVCSARWDEHLAGRFDDLHTSELTARRQSIIA